MPHWRNKKLIDAAEGQRCVLCHEKGSTVAAHSNLTEHGKGQRIKAPDYFTAWLCQTHHDLIDGRVGKMTKPYKRDMWLTAYARTVKRWFESGLVIVNKDYKHDGSL